MSWAVQLVLALGIFAGGAASGIKYHVGVVASKELAAQRARESDAIQQRKFNDKAAGDHAAQVATLANQLGDARASIATLSGRACLDAGTVRVLNAIGGEPVRAAASEPARASQAVATDRDVATALATCRAWYGELSSQVNNMIDIEERRHPR